MAVCSFILAFPLIYALLIVVFCFIVIGYIIKSPFGRWIYGMICLYVYIAIV